jgi:hypothetical protein
MSDLGKAEENLDLNIVMNFSALELNQRVLYVSFDTEYMVVTYSNILIVRQYVLVRG